MDKHETRSTAAQVHAMVSQHFTAGQRVQIQFDSDGAAGSGGTIRTVFPSGRCLVDLDCGGFRNLSPECLKMLDVTFIRKRLSEMSHEDALCGQPQPPEYDWFTSGSDAVLLQDVLDSAADEGVDPYTADGLEHTLSVMYFG